MTDTLLPPNATALERAVASTTGRIDALPTPLSDVWSPADCPVDALPWLAWSFGVEDWSAGWSEQQRRAVIEQAIAVKRYRGTIGAVQLAINALGLTCRVQEWFNQIPPGDPYTYNLLLDVDQIGYSLPQLRQMRGIVERTKNLRSHPSDIHPSATSVSSLVIAAVASVGCEITVLMDNNTDYVAVTLTISANVSALPPSGTAQISFTFSGNVGTSFVRSDITVTGGTLGPLSGSGLVRTALFTAGAIAGPASISVETGSYSDTAFPAPNAGLGHSLALAILDVIAPTLVISSELSQLDTGATTTITFTFSEDIGTSFEHSDITVTGGTLGLLSGSGLVRVALFTAGSVSGQASISVATGSYSDTAFSAPNLGIGHSLVLTVNYAYHYFENVSLLLHADGVNGSNVLIDSSPNASTVTASGSARISNEGIDGGKTSILLTDHKSTISIPNSSKFDLSGDFTLETHIKYVGEGIHGGAIFGRWGLGYPVYNSDFIWYIAGGIQGFIIGGSSVSMTDSTALPLSTWVHIAVTRSGNIWKIWRAGNPVATLTSATAVPYSESQDLRMGVWNDLGSSLHAYFDEMVITKGICKYTDVFTPPDR